MNNLTKILFYFVLIMVFTECKTTKINKLSTKENLSTIISNWHIDAANANYYNYFNRISNNGFYIGTDQSENWTKKEFQEFAKPYFDKKNTWNFNTITRNVYFSKDKNTAWFNELLDTWMGTCRGSGVLELEKNEWRIKQYVLSVTIPNTQIKKVISIKKEVNSN